MAAKLDPTICYAELGGRPCGQRPGAPIHREGSSVTGAHQFQRVKVGPIGRVPGWAKALPFVIIGAIIAAIILFGSGGPSRS